MGCRCAASRASWQRARLDAEASTAAFRAKKARSGTCLAHKYVRAVAGRRGKVPGSIPSESCSRDASCPKVKLRRAVHERQRRALAVVVGGRCASDGPTVKVVGRLSGIDRIDAGVRGLPCTRLRRGPGLRPNRRLLDGDASTAAIRAK